MQSHSMDMEEAMINRLKQVSAFPFSKENRERMQIGRNVAKSNNTYIRYG